MSSNTKRLKILPTYIKGKSINGNDTKMIDNILNQLCSRCDDFYPMSIEYFENRKVTNGFNSWCKKCKNKKPKNLIRNSKPIYIHFDNKGDLLCTKCKKYLSLSLFGKAGSQKYRGYKTLYCNDCTSIDSNNKYTNVKINITRHLSNLVVGCKQRSKKTFKTGSARGKEFNISSADLLELWNTQNGLCAISGLPMTSVVGRGRHNYNISVDRIDCNIGYIRSNIQLVCGIVNIMKNNLSIKELTFLCKNIIKQNENKK